MFINFAVFFFMKTKLEWHEFDTFLSCSITDLPHAHSFTSISLNNSKCMQKSSRGIIAYSALNDLIFPFLAAALHNPIFLLMNHHSALNTKLQLLNLFTLIASNYTPSSSSSHSTHLFFFSFVIINSSCITRTHHAGNSLIVNIGLTDLVVTIIVIPMSIVSLLAINKDDEEAPLSVCKSQWFLAACAFLVSVLTLAVSSATLLKKYRLNYFEAH